MHRWEGLLDLENEKYMVSLSLISYTGRAQLLLSPAIIFMLEYLFTGVKSSSVWSPYISCLIYSARLAIFWLFDNYSCCCSVTKCCLSLCNPMDCSMPNFPVLHHLPELAQTPSIELVLPSNHLILCHPLLLLPSIFPNIRVFSNESLLFIRWPKYWSFSFNISLPMNSRNWSPLEWTGWISLQSKGLSRVFSSTTVQKH